MNRIIGADEFWKALEFATEYHKFQRRKGYNRVPYINHPVKVTSLLASYGERDPILLSAALLHDVLEDTTATEEMVRDLFGDEICNVVLELTDDMSLPKIKRKDLQIQHAPTLSPMAKKIKIADKTSNMTDLLNYPINWSDKRKADYFTWAEKVVENCVGVNPALESYFYSTLRTGLALFNGKA